LIETGHKCPRSDRTHFIVNQALHINGTHLPTKSRNEIASCSRWGGCAATSLVIGC
jgi:hypothetical protein